MVSSVCGRGRLRAVLAVLAVSLAVGPRAGLSAGPPYVCREVVEVVDEVRRQGVNVLYSSELLSGRLRVREEPSSQMPRPLLAEILAPHGLAVRSAAAGSLQIVPAPGLEAERRGAGLRERPPSRGLFAMLPRLVYGGDDGGELQEVDIPGDLELRPGARFLVLRLGDRPPDGWQEVAFRLKSFIVESRRLEPALEVALDGDPERVARLLEHGLEPYVDGYVSSVAVDPLPAADPTGQRWWRLAHDGPALLERLLSHEVQGAAVVILPGEQRDGAHRVFLDEIRALPGGYMDPQPRVTGLAEGRSYFFYDPAEQDYYFAVYARGGAPEDLVVSLAEPVDVSLVYPAGAEFALDRRNTRLRLLLDGAHPNYLFRLRPRRLSRSGSELLVESDVIIDPYEVVVLNQVFQATEAEKVRSLELIERIDSVPLDTGGDRLEWRHEVIHRAGRLTDYLHLGVDLNGVPTPRRKLRKGRLGRPAATIELQPLQIEFDKTYRYEYLGSATYRDRPVWIVGFRPVRRSGQQVSGEAWIDKATGAHHKLVTRQTGLGGTTLSSDTVTTYGWIADEGQCFWNWRRREEVRVDSHAGETSARSLRTVRERFRYNRAGVGERARAAYASDALIHVESPPDGHRWLVKSGESRGPAPSYPSDGLPVDGGSADSRPDAAGAAYDSGRLFADPGAFSSSGRVTLGSNLQEGDADSFLAAGYTDIDFLGRDYHLFVGTVGGDGRVRFGNPNLFGRGWTLSAAAERVADAQIDPAFRLVAAGEAPLDLSVAASRSELRVGLTMPWRRFVRLSGRFEVAGLEFRPLATTAADFVLPADTDETILGVEVAFDRRRVSGRLLVEHGRREEWRGWGLGGGDQVESDFERFVLTVEFHRRVGRKQSLGVRGLWAGGSSTDRFSRYRLFDLDAVVAGYSSRFSLDEGLGLRGVYRAALGRMPTRLRLDMARLTRRDMPETDRFLAGVRLDVSLHGPLRTDILIGLSQGLASDPAVARAPILSAMVSRRFGG